MAVAFGIGLAFLPKLRLSLVPKPRFANEGKLANHQTPPVQTPIVDEDPRLTFATPYRNVRPDARYVGDDSCAQCHLGQAETYRRHPMGRTLALVSRPGGDERYDRTAHNPFEALGVVFSVEQRGGRVVHKQFCRDPQGRILTEVEAEALLALGSGMHGHSYLLSHDGYVFHSPIIWYTQKHAWGLSPEFEEFYPRLAPITIRCLFCHSNDAGWENGPRPLRSARQRRS